MVSGGFQILVNYSFIFLYQFGFDIVTLNFKYFLFNWCSDVISTGL